MGWQSVAPKIHCPVCGKLADPRLERCPHCETSLTRGFAGSTLAPSARGNKCPSCKSNVQDGDIICVRCGTNLLTGHKVAEEQEAVAVKDRGPLLRYLAFGAACLVLLAAAGALVYLVLQTPMSRAKRLRGEGRRLESIEIMEGYVKANPDGAEAQLLLGKLQYEERRYDRSVEALNAAAELDPEDEETALLAVAAASQSPGGSKLDGEMAALRRLAERDSGDMARFALGLGLGEKRDYAQSVAVLQEAAKAAPGGTEIPRSLGMALALSGDTAAARAALEQALEADPEEGDTLAALGILDHLDGRIDEAIGRLEGALDKGTAIATTVQTRLGTIYMARGAYTNALPLLREAKANPEAGALVSFYYALCLEANGLDTQALEQYERIVAEGGLFAVDAAIQSALLFMAREDTRNAHEVIRQAIQLGAASAKAYTIQARLYLIDNDPAEAQAALRQAIKAGPDYAPAHLENGLLYVSRGVLAEGVRALERYLQLTAETGAAEDRAEIGTFVEQLRETMQDGRGAVQTGPAVQDGRVL